MRMTRLTIPRLARHVARTMAATALGMALMLSPHGAWAESSVTVGVVGKGAFGPVEVHRSEGDEVTRVANLGAVFEQLVGLNPDGSTYLKLAESIEPEDATATKWIIKIRQGVKFHDGKEMDSEDVVFSIKRMTEPGMIPAGLVGPIANVEVVDKYTVRITYPGPKNWVIESLSDPYCVIVEAGFDKSKPIGTGPYMIGAITNGQSVSLERFADYWGEPAASDRVDVQMFGDSQAALNAITGGQVDMIMNFDPSLADEIEGNADLVLYDSPTGQSYPIQMRTDVAPFSDERLRQALRLVLDRDAMVFSAYGGHATRADDLYGRADPLFATELKRERDVEKAKALIEEAGLAGTKLDLVMNGDATAGLILAENAKEIGIEINVTSVDAPTFYNEEYMERPFFGGDYWPPMSYLMTSSMVDAPNASFGQIRWKDETYFADWKIASETLDPEVRKEKVANLQQILFDRGSWIIGAYPNELIIHSAKLTGLPESDLWGRAGYRYIPRLAKTE